ncbi:MAG: thermonuclease family protein [Alphaproteobacteria bacterium]|nr:thermonuclease family protein [Alphaproteobacteria bacterium]
MICWSAKESTVRWRILMITLLNSQRQFPFRLACVPWIEAKCLALLISLTIAACTIDSPHAIEGDVLVVHGERVRLFGIDAPHPEQTCTRDGRPYPCGAEAIAALTELIGLVEVTCRKEWYGANGQPIGVCTVGSTDVGAWMVSEGWALADREASTLYAGQEKDAKAARKGLWRGTFVEPKKWRRP